MPVLRFPPFELDLDLHELRKGGQAVRLQRRVFSLLRYLVDHRARLVTREEILRDVWSGTAVTDASLTVTMSAVRAALEEDPRCPRWIETHHGVGYRFIGAVQTEAASLPGADAALRALFCRPALAVLPLDVLAGKDEDLHLAEALVDDLITRLSAARLIPVLARQSTLRYRGTLLRAHEIAGELAVGYLVEGSLRLGPDRRVRINLRLVDAASSRLVATVAYDCDVCEVLRSQQEAAISLSARLTTALLLGQAHVPTGVRRVDDAWLWTARGWGHALRGGVNERRRAKQFFQQALGDAAPPSLAMSGLAHCELEELLADAGQRANASLAQIRELLERARTADELSPIPHALSGQVDGVLLGNIDSARMHADRALELDPSCVFAHQVRSWACYRSGDIDEALEANERCLQLSPHDPLLGLFLYQGALCRVHSDRFEEALPALARCRQLDRSRAPGYALTAVCLGHLGRREEAERLRKELEELDPTALSALRASIGRQHHAWPDAIRTRFARGIELAGWEEILEL